MAADVPNELDELRAENSRGYAERAIAHSCLFGDTTDDTIPEGFDCGGCSCHLSAPCGHCLTHLEDEESQYIRTMTGLTGRWTR
jgi:hypothetical protein